MIDDWWTGKDLEGSNSGLVDLLFRKLLLITEENHEILVRVAGVPTDIRTEHLPNTDLEWHRYDNPLGKY
jgi:hypothetical protein